VVTAISTAEYPSAAKRPSNCELDSSKFHSTFGFRARPWQERVGEVVAQLIARTRATEAKPTDAKTGESKPADAKSAEAKAEETKLPDSKASEIAS
jgi:hypothetical protein